MVAVEAAVAEAVRLPVPILSQSLVPSLEAAVRVALHLSACSKPADNINQPAAHCGRFSFSPQTFGPAMRIHVPELLSWIPLSCPRFHWQIV